MAGESPANPAAPEAGQMAHRLRYVSFGGPIPQDARERVWASELMKIGDAVLVWVNEGDLGMVGDCLDKREPGIEELKTEIERLRDVERRHKILLEACQSAASSG